MKRSSLKRKTPLRAKTTLKTRSTIGLRGSKTALERAKVSKTNKVLSKLKLPKKKTVSKLREEAWQLTRKIAYIEQKDDNGMIHCYTCGAFNIEGYNRQLGHCRPNGVCSVVGTFDRRNLRWQCMRCNKWLGGMGSEFRRKLIDIHGEKYVTDFEKMDSYYVSHPVNARDYLYELIAKLKQELEELKNAN